MFSTKIKRNVWILLVILVIIGLVTALFIPLVAGYR